jgi:hypothetical protein
VNAWHTTDKGVALRLNWQFGAVALCPSSRASPVARLVCNAAFLHFEGFLRSPGSPVRVTGHTPRSERTYSYFVVPEVHVCSIGSEMRRRALPSSVEAPG